MDLAAVLADDTDGLGHPALTRYYRALLRRWLPEPGYEGWFRVRAALNFGVQQLATRSRVSPGTQGYLQVGGFDPDDLPAALIEAMPHMPVHCVGAVPGTAAAVDGVRRRLPADALPASITWETSAERAGRFGLVAVFSEGAPVKVAAWRAMLGRGGRVLGIERVRGGRPVLVLYD